jgi:hypothetical protein
MGRENECRTGVLIDVTHQVQNALPRSPIKVGSRLISEYNARVGHERASNGHALTLPTGKLVRSVARVFAQPNHGQVARNPFCSLLSRHLGHLQKRVLDVLFGGQDRKQIKGLENEADGSRTHLRKFVGRLPGHILPFNFHSTLAWCIDAPHDIQQRRFAASGRSGDRHEHTGLNGQRYALKGCDVLITESIYLAYVINTNNWHRCTDLRCLLSKDNIMSLNFCLPSSRARCCGLLLTAAALCSGGLAYSADDTDIARTVVAKADEVRFPNEGFQVVIDINSSSPGEQIDQRKYRILSKGNENTIVQILEPESDRGQAMLMRGRDLWVFMPNISQPVRLSLAQRLTGQVANGDLARANFSGDYEPKILRSETIDGEKMHVLELTAVDRGVTYAKVLYWVRQSNNWPHKAEFYSVSDRLLKVCRYEKFQSLGGRIRPTQLVMEDALKKGDVSVLRYTQMTAKDLPDRVFTKQYMDKLNRVN